jgi:dihydroorotase
VIRGGQVIDPKNGIHGRRDIAVRDGRIAAVAAPLPGHSADRTIDASGLIVTPGLVDMHVHVYAGTGLRNAYDGDNSVYPDGFTFRSGVTTVVDAGSSGWKNFLDFQDRIIDRARTRVLAFLNIVGGGMSGAVAEQNVADMDAAAAADMARKNPDVIVGIKTAHFEGPEWIAVDRAIEAGSRARIPVMVDFGDFRPERPYRDLVTKKLRPGDISTHMYLGAIDMLDENGKVKAYLAEARRRGVLFDVGHGGGSFVFRLAVPAVRQSWIPDTISTDLHTSSMNAGMKDMLNVMSKFLNLGMSLEEVISRSTWNPARSIHRPELGSLSVGGVADIAILRQEIGRFGFIDSAGLRMEGTSLLSCELTIRDGRVVWDRNGISREDWRKYPSSNPPASGGWDATLPVYPLRKR